MFTNHLPKKYTPIILVALALLTLLAVALVADLDSRLDFLWNNKTNVATSTDEITNETVDTSNWKTYRNEEYGFEFKYPDSWYWDEKNKILSNYDPNKVPAVGGLKPEMANIELNIKNEINGVSLSCDASDEDAPVACDNIYINDRKFRKTVVRSQAEGSGYITEIASAYKNSVYYLFGYTVDGKSQDFLRKEIDDIFNTVKIQ